MDLHFQNLQKSNFMRFQDNSDFANKLGPLKKNKKRRKDRLTFF